MPRQDSIRLFDYVFAVIYGGYLLILMMSCLAEAKIYPGCVLFTVAQTAASMGAVAALLSVGWAERRYTRTRTVSPLTLKILMLARILLIEAFHSLWGDPLMTGFLYASLALTGYVYWGKPASHLILVSASGQFLIRQTLFLTEVERLNVIVENMFLYVVFFIVIALIALIIEMIDRERANRHHAEHLLDQLETMHTQMVQLATVEERNRLARDIHDSLGHYLTVINIQLEKALAYQHDEPLIATRSIQDSRRLAREALDDVRQSVTALRQTNKPFEFRLQLNALIDDMRRTGAHIDYHYEGDDREFSHQALMTLYRVAQEAFTNIRKHAQATQIEVIIRFTSDEARLIVHDNGIGFDPQHTGQGYGLQGLHERLDVVCGVLTILPLPDNGTEVTASLPCNPITFSRHLFPVAKAHS